MTDLATIRRVYFIGIGGIGMSAIARYFLHKGVVVSGYDKTKSPLTTEMEAEGMKIHYEDNIALVDKDAQLVIYTPAIPKSHAELNFFRDHNYEVEKRSEVLQQITKSSFNICIAGTHGKTTISTMIAHILRHAGFGCTAFLGGISVNYDTNFLAGKNNVCVVEADEYDRSFLKLSPDIALISAMDADHLDIYGNVESMRNAFVAFANLLGADELLLTKFGLPEKEFSSDNHARYSLQNESADVYASNITMRSGGYIFDVISKGWRLDNVKLNVGGMHNVENVVAAIFIANYLNVPGEKIRSAVETFKGVRRRFEYVISPEDASHHNNNVVFIDDYAHHPAELYALIKSAKSLFSDRTCTVIFQPHLFSRTRDFAADFAKTLDMANEVLLLPIHPARELPMEGVTSATILEKMENENARVITKEKLLEYLQEQYPDSISKSMHGGLLITAGAGDIDRLVLPIKKILLNDN